MLVAEKKGTPLGYDLGVAIHFRFEGIRPFKTTCKIINSIQNNYENKINNHFGYCDGNGSIQPG